MTLAVVTYLYRGEPGKPQVYTADHVNVLSRMVARNLSVPHTFWCIGDTPEGLDSDIRFRECDRSLLPLGGCYVRLELWRRDIGELLGCDRILQLDVDGVVCGSLDEVVSRPESVVIWRDAQASKDPHFVYNASMILMDAGARPEVWEDFDPKTSPQAVIDSGIRMFDQAWIAMKLGPDAATFTPADGVLSYKLDGVMRHGLPPNARICFFHGRPKPWQVTDPWVQQHWR